MPSNPPGQCPPTLPYLLHDVHAISADLAEGRKSHAIQARVVAVVDEELRGPRVGRTGLREGDIAGGGSISRAMK